MVLISINANINRVLKGNSNRNFMPWNKYIEKKISQITKQNEIQKKKKNLKNTFAIMLGKCLVVSEIFRVFISSRIKTFRYIMGYLWSY